MKQTTFELMIDKIIDSEKRNEVLRYKNTELNGAMQGMKSQITQLKAQLLALKNGVDVTDKQQ